MEVYVSMYVPTTLNKPAAALAPVGIVSAAPQIGRPGSTGISVGSARLNVLDGRAATVTGALHPGLTGRMVTLQALGRRGWTTVARARTNARGRFKLRYRTHQTGSQRVRLQFSGDALNLGAHRRLGWLNVYRLALASWYGGGGGLACGGSLSASTMGVANKTLPCGTLVTLRYGGRSVRVPVVDRGPYVAGREFDLTQATKQALGFGDTGEVWTTR
jgi:rare lipoprotein A